MADVKNMTDRELQEGIYSALMENNALLKDVFQQLREMESPSVTENRKISQRGEELSKRFVESFSAALAAENNPDLDVVQLDGNDSKVGESVYSVEELSPNGSFSIPPGELLDMTMMNNTIFYMHYAVKDDGNPNGFSFYVPADAVKYGGASGATALNLASADSVIDKSTTVNLNIDENEIYEVDFTDKSENFTSKYKLGGLYLRRFMDRHSSSEVLDFDELRSELETFELATEAKESLDKSVEDVSDVKVDYDEKVSPGIKSEQEKIGNVHLFTDGVEKYSFKPQESSKTVVDGFSARCFRAIDNKIRFSYEEPGRIVWFNIPMQDVKYGDFRGVDALNFANADINNRGKFSLFGSKKSLPPQFEGLEKGTDGRMTIEFDSDKMYDLHYQFGEESGRNSVKGNQMKEVFEEIKEANRVGNFDKLREVMQVAEFTGHSTSSKSLPDNVLE